MEKIKILDFYTKFCGPCKMLSPIIDQLIDSYKDNSNVIIEKLDADENIDLAKQYGIRTVPTILFIKDDIVIHKINGATNKKVLIDKIEEYLN